MATFNWLNALIIHAHLYFNPCSFILYDSPHDRKNNPGELKLDILTSLRTHAFYQGVVCGIATNPTGLLENRALRCTHQWPPGGLFLEPMMAEGTPKPPYYAVIFTSIHATYSGLEYEEMATKMIAMARQQPGFLSVDSARNEVGITVSYWESLDAIAAWKAVADHQAAQAQGKKHWYQSYNVRIARVEREYSFVASKPT
jgi:heme-degrading monooxygenase HmoA